MKNKKLNGKFLNIVASLMFVYGQQWNHSSVKNVINNVTVFRFASHLHSHKLEEPGQLRGFQGLPAGGRHGDGGCHGEPDQGESRDHAT